MFQSVCTNYGTIIMYHMSFLIMLKYGDKSFVNSSEAGC